MNLIAIWSVTAFGLLTIGTMTCIARRTVRLQATQTTDAGQEPRHAPIDKGAKNTMNKFEKILSDIGKVFVTVFTDVDKAAVVAEPFVDVAFPALAPLYNAASNGAAAALTAGKSAVSSTNTEAGNLVAIALAIEPILIQFAQQAGLTPPTTATVIAYAGALQASLSAAKK